MPPGAESPAGRPRGELHGTEAALLGVSPPEAREASGPLAVITDHLVKGPPGFSLESGWLYEVPAAAVTERTD